MMQALLSAHNFVPEEGVPYKIKCGHFIDVWHAVGMHNSNEEVKSVSYCHVYMKVPSVSEECHHQEM